MHIYVCHLYHNKIRDKHTWPPHGGQNDERRDHRPEWPRMHCWKTAHVESPETEICKFQDEFQPLQTTTPPKTNMTKRTPTMNESLYFLLKKGFFPVSHVSFQGCTLPNEGTWLEPGSATTFIVRFYRSVSGYIDVFLQIQIQ